MAISQNNEIKLDSKDDRLESLDLSALTISLRSRFKLYIKRAKEIEGYLIDNPNDWGKFQSEFNMAVDAIFRDIMNFEKINVVNGSRYKVEKLKKLFIHRIRKLFMRKEYSEWSISKPLGYAGDFKIIDAIYQNNPTTLGFDRLFDNYYMMSAIAVGVRNRKEDFKRLIINYANNFSKSPMAIMNLASGPGRDVREILISEDLCNKNIYFDCYDNDERALEFSSKLIRGFGEKVNFIKVNALRLTATDNIRSLIKNRYDLIYSTGLFDYLSDKILLRFIPNLKKLLKPRGILAVANVGDKYSNPSVHYMEWAGDWNLIYRRDDAFKDIFIKSGFDKSKIRLQYEQQGIMQYVIAINDN
jgi:hypothetical protein